MGSQLRSLLSPEQNWPATNTIPHEMVLLDLYEALNSLDRLTGGTTSDDILSLIFSKFCIGK